jgi:hypothetical protein
MIFLPQHDYPVGVIPDECGECATNSGCRAKCTPSGKSLCVQAVKPLYGRSFLFACGVNGGAARMYLDRFYPSRRARRSICHPLSTKSRSRRGASRYRLAMGNRRAASSRVSSRSRRPALKFRTNRTKTTACPKTPTRPRRLPRFIPLFTDRHMPA